jgi:hypothetical protein
MANKRVLAIIKFYNAKSQAWEDEQVVTEEELKDTNGKLTIHLARDGGCLEFVPTCIDSDQCQQIMQEIETKTKGGTKYFKQYGKTKVYKEPRLHFLLSQLAFNTKACKQPGFNYHNRSMKAHPMRLFPEILRLTTELAEEAKLPRNIFNIGADVLLYRSNQDSIHWHSDNSQSESIIRTVVVESPVVPRAVHIRPIGQPNDREEYVVLFPCAGDSYTMDGKCLLCHCRFFQ